MTESLCNKLRAERMAENQLRDEIIRIDCAIRQRLTEFSTPDKQVTRYQKKRAIMQAELDAWRPLAASPSVPMRDRAAGSIEPDRTWD